MSLYVYIWKKINLKKIELSESSSISINASNIASENAMNFLNEISLKYKKYHFIPQSYQELLLNYFGFGEIGNVPYNFPRNIGSKFYKEGKVKYFLNAKSWFDYMKDIDISIGTRLHGNIVATINGTPSITIIHDARMKELADYHALPSISGEEIGKYNNLTQLINDIDFQKVEKQHEKRFNHFIDFIEENGLDHIYEENRNNIYAPLDKLIEATQFDTPIQTITAISHEEKVLRLTKGFKEYDERQKRLNKK